MAYSDLAQEILAKLNYRTSGCAQLEVSHSAQRRLEYSAIESVGKRLSEEIKSDNALTTLARKKLRTCRGVLGAIEGKRIRVELEDKSNEVMDKIAVHTAIYNRTQRIGTTGVDTTPAVDTKDTPEDMTSPIW